VQLKCNQRFEKLFRVSRKFAWIRRKHELSDFHFVNNFKSHWLARHQIVTPLIVTSHLPWLASLWSYRGGRFDDEKRCKGVSNLRYSP